MNNIYNGNGWTLKLYENKFNKDYDLLSLQYLDIQKYPYLLESSSRGNVNNRFSILFYKPEYTIEKTTDNFLSDFDQSWLKEKIDQEKLVWGKKKLPFSGGWFVYFGYELSKEIEPKLNIPDSPYQLPTAFVSRIKTAIIFDHIDNQIFIVSEDKQNFADICKDIESDLRDAGSAVKLEETIVALEELITQLDASGLTNELPMGALWDFQREGLLPWEKESLPQEDRLDTDDDVLRQISGKLIDHDVAIKSETSIISENWEEMEPPKDEEVNHQTQSLETESVVAEVTEVPQTNQDDERAMLEDELARLDARWEARKEPNAITSNSEVLLNSLEDELSGVEW